MIQPTWTYGVPGTNPNALIITPDNGIIPHGTGVPNSELLNIQVDFTTVMQGQVQLKLIFGIISEFSNITIRIANHDVQHVNPFIIYVIQKIASTTISKSFYFSSGLYILQVFNNDLFYDTTFECTANWLSWPNA